MASAKKLNWKEWKSLIWIRWKSKYSLRSIIYYAPRIFIYYFFCWKCLYVFPLAVIPKTEIELSLWINNKSWGKSRKYFTLSYFSNPELVILVSPAFHNQEIFPRSFSSWIFFKGFTAEEKLLIIGGMFFRSYEIEFEGKKIIKYWLVLKMKKLIFYLDLLTV